MYSNIGLKADLHTHTLYSHGAGGILDNVRTASEKGVAIVGIADHGPGHRFYGIRLSDVANMRKDIDQAKADFPDTEVLLGLEANIINPDGTLDVSREEQALFDYIIAGYHYGVPGNDLLGAVSVFVGGCLYSLTARSSVRSRLRNTDMVLRAIYENDLRIVSHPGEKAAFDIAEIAKACSDRGCLMEINNHHKCLTTEGIAQAAEYDVGFVISSDAHRPEDVGCFELALRRAEEAGLPPERIVNLRTQQKGS